MIHNVMGCLGSRGRSHPLLPQFFLSVFFALAFGAGLLSGFTLGRPLTPASRIASKSALRYMPVGPIYRNGFISFLWSLLFTASEVIFKSKVISSIVISSISVSIIPKATSDQWLKWYNSPNSEHFTIQTYSSPAKKMRISEFLWGRPLTTLRAWGIV